MPAGGAGARQADIRPGDHGAQASRVSGCREARRVARRQPSGLSSRIAGRIAGRGQQSVRGARDQRE
jgi:hypothetical protein